MPMPLPHQARKFRCSMSDARHSSRPSSRCCRVKKESSAAETLGSWITGASHYVQHPSCPSDICPNERRKKDSPDFSRCVIDYIDQLSACDRIWENCLLNDKLRYAFSIYRSDSIIFFLHIRLRNLAYLNG